MKSVLISIKPQWCELIASGKKAVEVRKTRPKIDTPFKCYIYCTSSNVHKCLMLNKNGTKLIYALNYKTAIPCGGYVGNGKVIGEFVCDKNQEYRCEFVDDDCYESIVSVDYDDDGDPMGVVEWSNDSDIPYIGTEFYEKCCVSYTELKKYMGIGFGTFYGWHISDLVIYDEPKGLSEFYRKCDKFACEGCEHLKYQRVNADEYDYECEFLNYEIPITRPPQSWCYVEGR